ncbi:hypothetical protein PHYBOEH_011758 [Phytophthora boehmeriae]|uniref:GH18 domain-containing protein n=1 Tax=Phytophthora boehmeriae TaxID=109152 RepID=A0A8T1VER8_9STRA|nr:hypothetical protein PHYBOEH_011758 [Phytophthora boehmeriae]
MVRSPPRRYEEEAETSAYYYPPGDMGPYLSTSFNQRVTPDKKKRSVCIKRMVPFICGVVVLAVVITIVAVTLNANSSNSSDESDGNGSGGSSEAAESTCPTIAAQNRTVAFWQSEVAGCDTVPDGVTHVVFGFALVADGVIVPSFQSSDDAIKQCVQQLQARCISAMASIGGSTNNDNMSEVSNATLFAESAMTLLSTFGFDGLDLDDETVGAEFSADRTVDLLKSTRESLDAAGRTTALLTYDAYFYEGNTAVCASESSKDYMRCFPTEVLNYVDWVNIMAYNVNLDNVTAAEIYAAAERDTFAAWKTQLGGSFAKATLGICIGGGCAYGPGPNATVIQQWTELARQEGNGGMMIYAASTEVAQDYPVTKSIVAAG